VGYRLLRNSAVRCSLRKLPDDIRRRLEAQIEELANDPRPPGARNVIGVPRGYRIHVTSSYVVVYTVDDQEQTVTILRADHRKDVYRGL
jgi:mRNA interferase RelE/StbE